MGKGKLVNEWEMEKTTISTDDRREPAACLTPSAPRRIQLQEPALPAGSLPTETGRAAHNASSACSANPVFSEEWAAQHNHEIWAAGADGTYGWRNGPDGVFE